MPEVPEVRSPVDTHSPTPVELSYAIDSVKPQTPAVVIFARIFAAIFFLASFFRWTVGSVTNIRTLGSSGVYFWVNGAWVSRVSAPTIVIILAMLLPLLFLLTNLVGGLAWLDFAFRPRSFTADSIQKWSKNKLLLEGVFALPQICLAYWLARCENFPAGNVIAPAILGSALTLVAGSLLPALTILLIRAPRIQTWLAARDRFAAFTEDNNPRGVPW